jgi:hypothetical protein
MLKGRVDVDRHWFRAAFFGGGKTFSHGLDPKRPFTAKRREEFVVGGEPYYGVARNAETESG